MVYLSSPLPMWSMQGLQGTPQGAWHLTPSMWVRHLCYISIRTCMILSDNCCVCLWLRKNLEHHHSIGSLIDGAHLGPKTDRDYLGRYCPKTFETAEGKKEKWCCPGFDSGRHHFAVWIRETSIILPRRQREMQNKRKGCQKVTILTLMETFL